MKNYIPRETEEKIKPFLKEREILAITGPRQSGKTTLLVHLKKYFKKAKLINFEDEKLVEFFEEDPEAFYQLYGKQHDCLLLDEFQYIKKGGRKLKLLFDNYPQTKFIISGSSSLDLISKTSKYLVGRMLTFPLFPLSFTEFLKFKDKNLFKNSFFPYAREVERIYSFKNPQKKLSIHSFIAEKIYIILQEFITFGGYPKIAVSEKLFIKKKLLAGIINTYFLKEIKDLLALATSKQLKTLLKALALQIGNMINYHELSNLSNFNFLGLKKHLSILEETFIANRISPYFTNKRSELVKTPKVYFFDLGLRNALLDDFSKIEERVDKGAILENFVFTQLLKKEVNVKYWRTKFGGEVDFVIEKGRKVLPIEVKSFFPEFKIGKSLLSFIERYNPSQAIIFTLNGKTWKRKYKDCTIFCLPIFLA